MNELKEREIAFVSLNEAIDTSISTGMFVFGIFANLAEFERNLIRERTRAGLAVAHSRGRLGGWPEKLTEDQVKFMRTLYDSREHPIVELQ